MLSRYFIIFWLILPLALIGCENGPAAETAQPATSAESGSSLSPDRALPAEGLQAEVEARPANGQPRPPADEVTPVVAVVNGVVIDRQLFESQVVMAEAGESTFGQNEGEEPEEAARLNLALRLDVLNSLINLELACQEALARGYAPSAEEINQAVEAMKTDYEELGGLYKVLDQYGSSEEELTEQLTKTMALKKWQENDFLAQIRVTDAEASDFYDQNQHLMRHGDLVRASQIFFSVPLLSPPKAKEAAKAKGQTALRRLAAGEDFGSLAAELSDYPDASKDRGDLGWMEKGQSMPIFDQTVFNRLKPGQYSDLVESPMGFHIYKVTEVKAAGVDPFPEVKEDIRNFLSERKLEAALMKKMSELLAKADIEITDPELREAYEASKQVRREQPAAEGQLIVAPQGASESSAAR